MRRYDFSHGDVGGLTIASTALDKDYLEDILASENVVITARGETAKDFIQLKHLAIWCAEEIKVRFNKGTWVAIKPEEWLTVDNTDKRSIEFDTDGVGVDISFAY